MNVRFFSGTRQQYDSLPTPRNPLGLYFCSDTHELFWADRLLTDGMRVVDTYADLPDPTKAADGVVYYVNDTRNGYVVPHGTNKWLQTIYAPVQDVTKVPESEIYNTVTTVGAVRDIAAEIYGEISELDKRIADIEVGTSSSGVTAIYFAGYKLDSHEDGTYHIDRLCALRALGFSIPDGQDNIELITKDYIDNQIKSLNLGEYAKKTDLDDLATEDFVLAKIAALSGNDVDVSKFATKDEIANLASISYVDEKIASIKVPDVSKFITEIPEEYVTAEELAAEGFIKEHQSLEEYAKTKTVVTQKYEVLPIDGMIVSYNGTEVRVNTQHVDIDSLPKQNAGDGSSDKYYYATFRAYAPEGATSVVEGQSDKMDTDHSELAIDSFGRKYTTIWAAIASKNGNTWSKFGDNSTVDKYLGFYYNFHWYKDNQLIGLDKVRVILTNDSCHDDLVPDAVARRIDTKVNSVNTVVNNISKQINTIEETYVTNATLEANYVTNTTLQDNYTTVAQLESKVTEVIKDKVDSGEIAITANAISYGEF